tara:strand:+ start:79 stop:954 length:876 start_codon:yes stop_codon:yes gene_type:complete
MKQINIFGEIEQSDPLLRDKFIEPPFSVLDTKQGSWQRRKKQWRKIGIKSEVGRDVATYNMGTKSYKNKEEYYDKESTKLNTSIFDPALCELLYSWFCINGKQILDPFAGGSVRGIVANYLGYKYTGIDIRKEQIDCNRDQAMEILDIENQPSWYVGDSDKVLDSFNKEFDFVFSCPPYADLEVYSNLEGDISNMPYVSFMQSYESIIAKSCKLLKKGGYACFVVGEVRDKKGNYIGFVPDTIRAFKKCNMEFYNEAILLNAIASASMRAERNMRNQKLTKVHQNVLIFKK